MDRLWFNQHVSKQKPSLIDNIFINTIEKEIVCGNFISKITDHMPNFMIMLDILPERNRVKRTLRSFSNFKEDEYKKDIANINIDKAITTKFNDINIIYNEFHTQLMLVLDKHAPFTKLYRLEKQNGKRSHG